MTNQSDWDKTLADPFDNDETVLTDTEDGSKNIVDSSMRKTYSKGSVIKDLYVVKSETLNGGMGSVVCVHHSTWNIDLAMKQPHVEGMTQTKKELFVHECEAWINLGLHPNIVSCYYVRNIDGIPSIFSEWMDAGSVKDLILSGELYQGSKDDVFIRILDIMIQSAQGLQFAHSKGLIHQDVKPANILCGKDGSVKIADFGLANAKKIIIRSNAVDQNMTVLAENGGYTPLYCSPEQLNGRPVSVRSDIWNWAVTFLEVLTGGCRWNNGVIAGAACNEYITKAVVEVPEKLKSLLQKCFEIDENKRPHDFSAVITILLQIYKEKTKVEYGKTNKKDSLLTAEFLNNKALSYFDLNKFSAAQEAWQQALQIAPEHPAANYNYTLFQWRMGILSDQEAIDHIRKLYEADNSDILAVGLAGMLCESGRYSEIEKIQTRKENEKLRSIKETYSGEKNVFKKIRTIIQPGNKKMECFGYGGFQEDKSDGTILACEIIENGNRFLRLRPGNDCFELEKEIVYDDPKQEIMMFVYVDNGTHILVNRKNKILDLLDARTFELVEHIYDDSMFPIQMNYKLVANEDGSLVAVSDIPSFVDNKLRTKYYVWDMKNRKLLTSFENDSTTMFFVNHNTLAMNINRKDCQIEISEEGTLIKIDFPFDNGIGAHNFQVAYGEYAFHVYKNTLKIYEYPSRQNLLTIESEVELEPIAMDTNNHYLYLREGDQIIQRAFFANRYKCEWLLSKVISVDDTINNAKQFNELFEQADRSYREKDYALALKYVEQAAEIPGYNHNPELTLLNRKIGKYCVIDGFHNIDLNTGKETAFSTVSICQDRGRRYIQNQDNQYIDIVTGVEYELKKCEPILQNGLHDMVVGNRGHSLLLAHYGMSLENLIDSDKKKYDNLFNVLDDGRRTKYKLPEMKAEEIKSNKDKVVFHATDELEKILITVQQSGSIKKWDLSEGTIIQRVDRESNEHIYNCALSSRGDYLAICYGDSVSVWRTDVMSLQTVIEYDAGKQKKLTVLYDSIKDAVFMKNNDLITCGCKSQIVVWDIFSGEPKKVYVLSIEKSLATPESSIAGWIKSCSLSSNQKYILLCGEQFYAIFDLAREKEYIFPTEYTLYGTCSFTADKDVFASIEEKTDKLVFRTINWKYRFPGWSEWDDKALPIIRQFLLTHRSIRENDMDELLQTLQNSELGWIRKKGIEKKIEELTGVKIVSREDANTEYGLSVEKNIACCNKIR